MTGERSRGLYGRWVWGYEKMKDEGKTGVRKIDVRIEGAKEVKSGFSVGDTLQKRPVRWSYSCG